MTIYNNSFNLCVDLVFLRQNKLIMKILKSVAVIGFILGMSHFGLAQKIELGVKAGLNFSGLNLSSGREVGNNQV